MKERFEPGLIRRKAVEQLLSLSMGQAPYVVLEF